MVNDQTMPFDYGQLFTPEMRNRWVAGYLNNPDNFNKNFVQRINTMNNGASMSRQVGNNPQHKENLRMASSGNQVFPTIEMRNGQLETLPRGRAPQEVIQTTTPEQAEMLAWNQYKRNNPAFRYEDQQQKPQGWGTEELIRANRQRMGGLLSEQL